MSHAEGQVRFSDGKVKYFEFDGTDDICKPKLYNTYDELLDNWRKTSKEKIVCNHQEEPVDIYTNYATGYYWKGTACPKCNMILKGREPVDLENGERSKKGIPEWVENLDDY